MRFSPGSFLPPRVSRGPAIHHVRADGVRHRTRPPPALCCLVLAWLSPELVASGCFQPGLSLFDVPGALGRARGPSQPQEGELAQVHSSESVGDAGRWGDGRVELAPACKDLAQLLRRVARSSIPLTRLAARLLGVPLGCLAGFNTRLGPRRLPPCSPEAHQTPDGPTLPLAWRERPALDP